MIAIAIDGPAGAGKSTLAKVLASKLNYIYVDTGALYRAIAFSCIENNIDITDVGLIEQILEKTDIRIVFLNGEQIVLLNDKDVSKKIRTEDISMMASSVSAIPQVRKFLLNLQRNFSKTDNVIMDGRDIGTVVLPNAQVKIFLTASPEIRAKRRYEQLKNTKDEETYERILEKIIKRDYDDSHREIAPLKPSEESILVDTTNMTLEESVQKLLEIIKERII